MKRYTNEQTLKAIKYIVENIEALNKALDDALRVKKRERLEIIKLLRNLEKTVAPGMQPSELISRKDVDWLINRVEELEKQNKRYREALSIISANLPLDGREHYVDIARQALEDEE